MAIEHMALLIPILGIALGVGVAIVAIVAAHREKQTRVELRHRERLAAIEKGIELTSDPEPDAGVRKTSSLKSGLSGVFIGAVLYAALYRAVDEDMALFGLIPAALGIATLISYFVENRRPR
jgi:phosphatidylglycerophosphate synthase